MMLFEMECGALYRPLVEMLPVMVFPPVVPFTCQVTAVVGWPLIVAENCCVVKTSTVAVAGLTATVPPVWLVIVTVAEADFVVSATEVAVTVTVGIAGTVAGAVWVVGTLVVGVAGARGP